MPADSASPTKSHAAAWRYVLVDQGLVAILVNFAINWGIAWAIFRSLPVVPLRGELSLEGDTIATCWMLPLISCLIVTMLTGNEVRSGRIPGFNSWNAKSQPGNFLLHSLLIRAIGWALLGRFLIAPLAVQAIVATGLESLSLRNFLLFKAIFACCLGIFFCPFHAWWALHDGVKPSEHKA